MPADADNQGDLRKQPTKLLTDNPALLDELPALLEEAVQGRDALSQTVNGNSNKVSEVARNGNSVSIS